MINDFSRSRSRNPASLPVPVQFFSHTAVNVSFSRTKTYLHTVVRGGKNQLTPGEKTTSEETTKLKPPLPSECSFLDTITSSVSASLPCISPRAPSWRRPSPPAASRFCPRSSDESFDNTCTTPQAPQNTRCQESTRDPAPRQIPRNTRRWTQSSHGALAE